MRQLLQQHFLTSGFSPEELDTLLGICEYQQLREGQIVFSEQQPSGTFYILVKGKVTLFFGSDRIIEVSPRQVFGDWAMLSDTARLATAKVNLPSEAIAIDYEKLKNTGAFPADIALKVVFALTKPIIARLQSPSQIASSILISEGENQKVEFKETLRSRLIVEASAQQLYNFFTASNDLIKVVARAAGHAHIRGFSNNDLSTFSWDMHRLTGIRYAGGTGVGEL